MDVNTKQVPKKMPKVQIAAIVVLSFVVIIGAFYFLGVFDDFQTIADQNQIINENQTPLTPARGLEGTWKTAFPVKFYIKTDFQTGDLQDIGSENRTMTWVITKTSDENVVNVEVSFSISDRQIVSGTGYVPDVSPNFYTGLISGTRLTLKTGDKFSETGTVGEFNFTTDIMTGTWSDKWDIAYEQQVYTPTNTLILTRK